MDFGVLLCNKFHFLISFSLFTSFSLILLFLDALTIVSIPSINNLTKFKKCKSFNRTNVGIKTFFITFASLLFKKLANELCKGFNPQVMIIRNLFFLHSYSILVWLVISILKQYNIAIKSSFRGYARYLRLDSNSESIGALNFDHVAECKISDC